MYELDKWRVNLDLRSINLFLSRNLYFIGMSGRQFRCVFCGFCFPHTIPVTNYTLYKCVGFVHKTQNLSDTLLKMFVSLQHSSQNDCHVKIKDR